MIRDNLNFYFLWICLGKQGISTNSCLWREFGNYVTVFVYSEIFQMNLVKLPGWSSQYCKGPLSSFLKYHLIWQRMHPTMRHYRAIIVSHTGKGLNRLYACSSKQTSLTCSGMISCSCVCVIYLYYTLRNNHFSVSWYRSVDRAGRVSLRNVASRNFVSVLCIVGIKSNV